MLVVRPQPGHAMTIGVKERRPIVCRISWPTTTSPVRAPPGSGVSEMRIVSPMPSCSSTESAAVDATMPFEPMPASVSPRCSAKLQRFASSRYTAIRSCTPLTLHDRMILSRPRPSSTARSAEPIADWISASYITLCASHGVERAAFSSIMRASRSWSRLPQFTPMRTGLS